MKIEIFEAPITGATQANITRNDKTKHFTLVTQSSLERLFKHTSCKTCDSGFVSDHEEIWSFCPDCLSMDKCPKCGMENVIDWEGDPLKCYNPICDWEEV